MEPSTTGWESPNDAFGPPSGTSRCHAARYGGCAASLDEPRVPGVALELRPALDRLRRRDGDEQSLSSRDQRQQEDRARKQAASTCGNVLGVAQSRAILGGASRSDVQPEAGAIGASRIRSTMLVAAEVVHRVDVLAGEPNAQMHVRATASPAWPLPESAMCCPWTTTSPLRTRRPERNEHVESSPPPWSIVTNSRPPTLPANVTTPAAGARTTSRRAPRCRCPGDPTRTESRAGRSHGRPAR